MTKTNRGVETNWLVYNRLPFNFQVFRWFQEWIEQFYNYGEDYQVSSTDLDRVKRRYQYDRLDNIMGSHLLCYWKGIDNYFKALTSTCYKGVENPASKLWQAGYIVGSHTHHSYCGYFTPHCKVTKNPFWCHLFYLLDYTYLNTDVEDRDMDIGFHHAGVISLAGHKESLLSIHSEKELRRYRLFFLTYMRGACWDKERSCKEEAPKKKYPDWYWEEQNQLFPYYPERNRYFSGQGLFTPGAMDDYHGIDLSSEQIKQVIDLEEKEK